MSDPIPRPGWRAALFAFLAGLWLALFQTAYFFLLEVRLSSRTGAFFVVLFCWLVGFLVGLNLRSPRAFPRLLLLAPAGYYAAYLALSVRPYDWSLLPVVAVAVAFGGALAGSLFPHLESRVPRLKLLLLHENNGYVCGLLLALLGSVFAGHALLVAVPAAGALALGVLGRAWIGGPSPKADAAVGGGG
jgi:hypothetical protein